jgi:hypothetical protein
MDEEGMLIDIADVRGRAEALTCIMAAMVVSFVNKGLLAKDEAATLTSAAKTLLDNVKTFQTMPAYSPILPFAVSLGVG